MRKKTKALELSIIDKTNLSIVVSPVEKALLDYELPRARVEVLQLVLELEAQGPGYSKREGILFIGGYQHPPNVDAIVYFAREIFPKIRAKHPSMQLHVIGSRATDEVLGLHGNGVNVVGFVEDLREYFDRCLAMVVPVRYGAGIKGKIGTAFAYGLPVVSSQLGIEGMDLEEGHDVLVAEDSREWAAAIDSLVEDEALWDKLSEAGREVVRQRYSLNIVARQVAKLLESLQIQ